ncbi:hypothetical protein TcG_08795 [Trypanosoma cruzi]|nr:hypothetical protein TcG_08795 [Trypanosoma cruzi]
MKPSLLVELSIHFMECRRDSPPICPLIREYGVISGKMLQIPRKSSCCSPAETHGGKQVQSPVHCGFLRVGVADEGGDARSGEKKPQLNHACSHVNRRTETPLQRRLHSR